MLRVRPSEARDEHFADLPLSVNVSKSGLYFQAHRRDYYKGMRLFVTFPFAFANDPMNCEYLAEVVRVENLPNDRCGIAFPAVATGAYLLLVEAAKRCLLRGANTKNAVQRTDPLAVAIWDRASRM
ncbi:MAG: hypothetical protein WBL50_04935 [Candidatus Acidiferrum sp.]